MGIALFTLSTLHNPLHSLKRLFSGPMHLEDPPGQSRAAASPHRHPLSPPLPQDGHSDRDSSGNNGSSPSARHRPEPQGQRPLRANWPFTVRPAAQALEAPAKQPPTAHTRQFFLPVPPMGNGHQGFFAPLAADATANRSTRVRRHASDSGTGRLVLTGRMADVCAELERMAASEALQS